MEYIIDRTGKYEQQITDHLVSYNKEHLGERKSYGKHLYLIEDGKFKAGANTYLSWDWVRIGEIKYDSLENFQMIID